MLLTAEIAFVREGTIADTYTRAPPWVRLNARAVRVMKQDKSTASHAPAPVTHDPASCHQMHSFKLNEVIPCLTVRS